MPDISVGSIIPFKPLSTDAELILDQYIAEAQKSPFIAALGIVWSTQTWDLTEVATPDRSGAYVRFTFPELCPRFLDFIKAYVIHEIASNFPRKYQIGKYSAPAKNAKYVQLAMNKFNVSSPVDLTPQILDNAMSLFTGNDNTKEQNRSKVGWFVDVLLKHRMYNRPYKWSPPKQVRKITSRKTENRLKSKSQDKILSTDELDAVIHLFNRASTQEEKIVGGILALLCCAPMRAEELLLIPRDVDVMLDPGDNLQSGLVWRPKKGGIPGLKYVPSGMVDVANRALKMIKAETQKAHDLATHLMANNPVSVPYEMRAFKHYPFVDEQKTVRIDEALFVYVHGNRPKPIPYTWLAPRITHAQNAKKNIFRKLGILLPDGSVPNINTHKMRHYHNTIAAKCNMSEFDRARWSGRKNMAQNATYDHETPEELTTRIRTKLHGKAPMRVPTIFNEKEFNLTTIREAMHSTSAGWCSRSLRQDPCTMFGACLNCQHLVCVKGALGKLNYIQRDLERTKNLLQLAQEKKSNGLKLQDRWIDQYKKKIERLTQLIAILSDDTVEDGSFIMLADDPTLVAYNPVSDYLTSEKRHELSFVDEENLVENYERINWDSDDLEDGDD